MHVIGILHNLFASCRPHFDLRVLKTLFSSIEAVIRIRKIAVTSIGRSLERGCFVKHKIKAIDRLFCNQKLQNNVFHFYTKILLHVLGSNVNPVIIVDWSELTPCKKYHFIRAAIPVGGRALPILEIPYSVKYLGSAKAHKEFLIKLKAMLPKGCIPIILTDAGFRNTWFNLVVSFGWDYIGRIRNRTLCRGLNESSWQSIKSLYLKACCKPKYLGDYYLAMKSALHTSLYLYKEKKKNRIQKTLNGKRRRSSKALKHEKGAREPLLLATSLKKNDFKPLQIINCYKKRMQIEEGFRDLKNDRIGLSLRQIRCSSIKRLSITLMIGAISMFLLWVLGIAAKIKNLHYRFQANTIRKHNVLSLFMIGWQVLEERKIVFNNHDIKQAISYLQDSQYA